LPLARTAWTALAIAFLATFSVRADSTDGLLPADELHGPIIGDLPREQTEDPRHVDETNLVTAADHSAWDTLDEGGGLPLHGELSDPDDELDESDADKDGGGLSLIPEPSTLLMLGLAGLTVYLWRLKW